MWTLLLRWWRALWSGPEQRALAEPAWAHREAEHLLAQAAERPASSSATGGR